MIEHRHVVVSESGDPHLAVVPYSHEAISLREVPTQKLGEALLEARNFEREGMTPFKRLVQDEVIRRADELVRTGEQDSWTLHLDGIDLVCDTPDRTEWDVQELRGVLTRLVDEGEIEEHWLERIIVPDGYKVAKRELQRLVRLGGPAAEALKGIERPVARPRSVRVSR